MRVFTAGTVVVLGLLATSQAQAQVCGGNVAVVGVQRQVVVAQPVVQRVVVAQPVIVAAGRQRNFSLQRTRVGGLFGGARSLSIQSSRVGGLLGGARSFSLQRQVIK